MTFEDVRITDQKRDRENYQQCVLRKENRETVAWVPKKFAKKNFVLRIKRDREWDDGWIVHQPCHAWTMNGDEVQLIKDAHRYQRGVSDV